MSTNGEIRALSVSQAEKFDPAQTGGCPRRWWFEYPQGHRVESGPAQEDGDAGHALFAGYYRTGIVPQGRVKMGKAVRGAIAAGHLPPPEPGHLVESRFDGQPARNANGQRVPLDVSRTLWLGGVPWDGFVDLRFRRDDTVTVLDHKFSSDIHEYAKPADGLIKTIQMPVYALDSLRIWPDAKWFRLGHHYVSRRGVDSFIRWQTVGVDEIDERAAQVDLIVAEMQLVARATEQDDVPFNRKSCMTYSGCPHQSRCNAFRRNQSMALELNEEELAIFGPPPQKDKAQSAAELKRLAEEAAAAADFDGDGAAVAEAQDLHRAAKEAEFYEMAAAAERSGVNIPLPTASTPATQPEGCRQCGEILTPETSSTLQDGKRKHIGCPADAVTAPPASGPKCADCPHPAHPGQPCTGKRGTRNCRCRGVISEQPRLVESVTLAHEWAALNGGHLPTCVQNDAGKWLCVDGCPATGTQTVSSPPKRAKPATVGKLGALADSEWFSGAAQNPPSNFNSDQPRITPEQSVAVTRAAEQDDAGSAPYPTATGTLYGPLSGTLTVRVAVQVGLTPDTIAVLERLFKR